VPGNIRIRRWAEVDRAARFRVSRQRFPVRVDADYARGTTVAV